MTLDMESALERALTEGDEWLAWRALRLTGEQPAEVPRDPAQAADGSYPGIDGRPSPGATGLALCHLHVLGLGRSEGAQRAAEWLLAARTPAQAWLDAPSSVPGPLDDPGGARVWATAVAVAGLLVSEASPGPRAMELLRGESSSDGGLTGGVLPTAAGAAASWLTDGAKSEMAEWSLRWVRENEELLDPEDAILAGVLWAAAGLPAGHASVELILDLIRDGVATEGLRDLGDTVTALEVLVHFEGAGALSA